MRFVSKFLLVTALCSSAVVLMNCGSEQVSPATFELETTSSAVGTPPEPGLCQTDDDCNNGWCWGNGSSRYAVCDVSTGTCSSGCPSGYSLCCGNLLWSNGEVPYCIIAPPGCVTSEDCSPGHSCYAGFCVSPSKVNCMTLFP